jgi:radical SAM-linked protein
MNETYSQRMRVWFATGDTVKYVGHLDMHRTWERAIRRAGLPLAYTRGFNPQPRLQFAAALPVGFTGEAEVADVFLNEELAPEEFVARLAAALPPGMRPYRAEPVPRELPSLQSQVAGADYIVEVEAAEDEAAFCARLDAFLERSEAWRERRKGKEMARYDLRVLVHEAHHLAATQHGHRFSVLMRAEAGATGRPDELVAELGYGTAPRQIVRTRLHFVSNDPGGTDAPAHLH